jgi:hypothetical protein
LLSGALKEGQVDPDLGSSSVIKTANRAEQGKSSGYRAIILFQRGARALFVYGFAKSGANVDADEEKQFKEAVRRVLRGVKADRGTGQEG